MFKKPTVLNTLVSCNYANELDVKKQQKLAYHYVRIKIFCLTHHNVSRSWRCNDEI